ncbi:hypothetical protein [Candidatus Electronema sp. JM]|uniref:hypothetical protein n=1 Tax=Candidatus Electronema sp. JM TaxID=3401571 RepID=UPI003AA85058
MRVRTSLRTSLRTKFFSVTDRPGVAIAKAAGLRLYLRLCFRRPARQEVCALPRSRKTHNLEVKYAARWYELRGVTDASQFTSH